MPDFDELGEVFRDPNDSAYQLHEERRGPPLSYVQEKLNGSLQALHRLATNIDRFVPDSLEAPLGPGRPPEPVKDIDLLGPARLAFYKGVVAFLALSNMLALANDQELVDRLLAMDYHEFEQWLEGVERGGSVNG